MTVSEEQTQAVSSAHTLGGTDNAPSESSKTKMAQEMEDIKDEQDSGNTT